jgi:hypothetical protein
MCIILFGVMMAWVCAWKAKYYFNIERYTTGCTYVLLVIALLIIVFIEATRVTPYP